MKGYSIHRAFAFLQTGVSLLAGSVLYPFRKLAEIYGIIRRNLHEFNVRQKHNAMVIGTLIELGIPYLIICHFCTRYREKLAGDCSPALIRHYYREYFGQVIRERNNLLYYGMNSFGGRNRSPIHDMSELVEFAYGVRPLSRYESFDSWNNFQEFSPHQLSFLESLSCHHNILSEGALLFLLVFVKIGSLISQLQALADKIRKYRFSFSRQLSFAMITGRPSLANSPPFVPGI